MLAAVRRRQPDAPLHHVIWWGFVSSLCYIWLIVCYRFRRFGIEKIPYSGPVLFLSNHQSYLDPIIVGVGCGYRRQFYALARSTLWRNRAFAWLITSMNAVPVERGTADMAAMRRCIELLKSGQSLLIFPEGTRSLDGKTGPFASGTMLLIKRAKPVVIPVAVEGSFEAWPKGSRLRLFGKIHVQFGDPIPAEKLVGLDAETALEQLRQLVETMRLDLAQRMK